MKKRSIPKMAVLVLVTLGGYTIYWMWFAFAELQREHDKKLPGFGLYMLPLITFAFMLPIFYLFEESGAVMGTVVSIIGIAVIISYWWLWRFCAAVAQVTSDAISRKRLFLAAVVLDDYFILVVQHYFNRIPEKPRKSRAKPLKKSKNSSKKISKKTQPTSPQP